MSTQFSQLRAKRTHGFTLVELMAVTAVLAILLSLLIPTLAQAMRHARKAACANGLHNIGVAGFSYVAEQKCLPPDYWGRPWPMQFRDYVAGSAEMFNCPEAPAATRWNGMPFTTAYHLTPFSYSVCCWGAADGVYLGYWAPPDSPFPGRRPCTVADASNFFLVADSNCGLPENENTPLGPWDFIFEVHLHDWCTPYEWVGARHIGSGTNMLYADGHVEYHLRSDMHKAGLSGVSGDERIRWRKKMNVDNLPHEEYGN